MHPLLEDIFKTKTFLTSGNEKVKIQGETPKEQCEFLQKIIVKNNFKNSIEIGFAFGISTLAITESVVQNGGRHVVIDKFQKSDWNGMGLDLINQASYSNSIDFFEEYSYKVLPRLLEQEKQFDFAYVDSTKLMDWMFVDFFFLDKLLTINGVLVIDDIYYPGIKKLLRYFLKFPSYKLYQVYPTNAELITKKRKLLFSLLRRVPKKEIFLRNEVYATDFEMGINARCAAIIKTAEDKRNWDWHEDF